MPLSAGRSRGESAAAPPQAASTWNQASLARASPPSAGRSSTTPALVVPAVPTIRSGIQPAARSAWIRLARSATSSVQWSVTFASRSASVPSPAMRAIFTNE